MDTAGFVGFVPEPNCGRGTVGILWSCVVTIILSTWTTLHNDISPPGSSRWRWTKSKLGSAIYCALFPEALAMVAIMLLVRARRLSASIRDFPGWSQFSHRQSFLVVQDGIYSKQSSEIRHNRIHRLLEPDALVRLVQTTGLGPEDMGFPTDDEIEDRSKKDWLLKSISISQTLWFVANVLSRVVQGFQVSLLEDLTIAYAFCGLIMLIAWFDCPQDIHQAFIVDFERGSENGTRNEPQVDQRQTPNPAPKQQDLIIKAIPTVPMILVTMLLFGVFCGIHLAAWNYPFPSDGPGSAWTWRSCALATFILGFPSSSYLIMAVDDHVPEPSSLPRIKRLAVLLIMFLYVAIRLFTVFLSLYAFKNAPMGIYTKPSWTAYWAHL
ncbi:hypothetical protein B0T19DRAFT_473634 [Cercophora scortea]|uniref:Uncharacterized protein n=1 Tax=Cercophora scortea TaxID=314031 RepID=A0AAE0IX01_9PEZI|nr:hypothetical protein B0T19DRAFT_473634 [Cercophora scortea]